MTCYPYIGNRSLNSVSPHSRGAEDTKRMVQQEGASSRGVIYLGAERNADDVMVEPQGERYFTYDHK